MLSQSVEKFAEFVTSLHKNRKKKGKARKCKINMRAGFKNQNAPYIIELKNGILHFFMNDFINDEII